MVDLTDERTSENIIDRRNEKVGASFPLPNGYCREVCRPKRNKVRHFTLRALVRVVQSLMNTGTTAQEICETMRLFPEIEEECKPDCKKIVELVDNWLREFEQMKEAIGILDEFVQDLWPFEQAPPKGVGQMVRFAGNVILNRLKWLRWLLRGFALITGAKEIVNFIDTTHILLQDIAILLDEMCRKEHAKDDLGLGPR